MARKRYILLSVAVRILVGAGLLVIAVAVFVALVKSKPTAARSPTANTAPQVIVMEARPVEVRRQWDVFGTARAMDSADVPARVMASVIEICADVLAGAAVEKGQLLVQLDDSDFVRQEEIATQSIADINAQLARLEVEKRSWQERVRLAGEMVQLAQAEFDRVSAARQREVAKEREVDQARQALIEAVRAEVGAREEYDKLLPRRTSLRAQLLAQESRQKLARQNVARCRIVSPLAGVLESVDVEVGENLAAGQRVARVVDLGRIEVPLRVAASARPHLAVGDEVALWAGGDANRRWSARVMRISPVDDESTRTTVVFVEVEQDPQAPDGLVPGLFVRGFVSSSAAEQRWVVPRRALEGDRILLVNDGEIISRGVRVDYQVERKFPHLGPPDEQWVVLGDPLSEGDLVVVTGTRTLRDGMAVQPVRAVAEAPPSVGGGAEVPR